MQTADSLPSGLERLSEAGPSKILTELGIQATATFRLDTSVPSYPHRLHHGPTWHGTWCIRLRGRFGHGHAEKLGQTSVVLYEKTYRAVVVHSSSHDKRRQKKLAKSIAQSAKTIQAELDDLQKVYFCEADARKAAVRAEKFSDKLHTVTTAIRPVQVRRRGRPPVDRPAPTNTQYELSCEISENSAGVNRERRESGCFVLLSNVPTEGDRALDAASLLRTYKGQYGVESDFAFLKEPLVVNDLFLKTPSRIDALGMILMIALMIWRLMERSMRAYVENSNITLPGWDKRTTVKPTSFIMTTYMTGIMVAVIDGKRHLLRGPGPNQIAFLQSLGLGSPAFLDPHCRCDPVIPARLASKG